MPVSNGYAAGQQSTLLSRSKQKHPSHPGHHARGVQTEQTDCQHAAHSDSFLG